MKTARRARIAIVSWLFVIVLGRVVQSYHLINKHF